MVDPDNPNLFRKVHSKRIKTQDQMTQDEGRNNLAKVETFFKYEGFFSKIYIYVNYVCIDRVSKREKINLHL